MRIKDVIKQVDNNGHIIAFVVFVDGSGKESWFNIGSEQEYNYYKNQFRAQQEREKKYNRPVNTPGANYQAKSNPFINYEKHKCLRVSKKLLAIITAAIIGISGYVISKLQPNYTVVGKIQNPGIFHTTKESRYIDSNEGKFERCVEALQSGNYSDAPEFDAEFIRDYVHACYVANVDDLLTGGKLNGNRYKFNFDEYMTDKDRMYFDMKGNNPKYESFITSFMGDITYSEANINGRVDKSVDRYIEEPLEFMFQHLNPSDDTFAQMSPFARIVICEQVKSMLMLEEDSFKFFSHESPVRNATRDELIEQVDKKEQAAMISLDMQITQKQPNSQMEGRIR